ncbi:MAG: threonine/serine dehydratase [Thermomicrobiales bacterium]|nr:threonine/serine dehydratase [Thermomicrobiales bacterium]MCO5221939.1 threonine/serine dehydratase [Thermomicrobiales bacterium]
MSTTTESPIPTSITIETIWEARDRIAPYIHWTPVFTSETLNGLTGTRLHMKAENLQKTGAFKVRGALNAVAQLSVDERSAGVVTFSAGNHGQGLAFAAREFGVACTVFMTDTAVPSKVAAIQGYGASTRQFPTIQDAVAEMERTVEQTGAVFISPFANEAVIAGQATVALELLEQVEELEQVIVPIGGGGLISGTALTLRILQPDIRIVGVEPEGAPTMTRALQQGRPVTLESTNTIADGLTAPFTADLNLAIVRELVDDVVIVTDDEIVDALRLVLDRTKLLIEGSAAAGIAALLTGKAAVETGAVTAAILTGGNIDLGRLKGLL